MNVVIFGDSITWGAIDTRNGGWATLLRNYYGKQGSDIEIYNLGIPGDTTTNLLKRVESEANTRMADVIIFAIGANDANFILSKNEHKVPLTEFKQNIIQLTNIGASLAKKIIFVGLASVDESLVNPHPLDQDQSWTNTNMFAFDTVIESHCKENGLDYISMRNVISNEDLADGIHPNSDGHEKMFAVAQNQLSTIFGAL